MFYGRPLVISEQHQSTIDLPQLSSLEALDKEHINSSTVIVVPYPLDTVCFFVATM